MPGAVRLITIAALLLVAAAANLVVRSEPAGRWLPLLLVGVVGGVIAGAPRRLWPLPAIWLVGSLLVTTTGATVDGTALAVSLVAGAIALAVTIAVDVIPFLQKRRRGAGT